MRAAILCLAALLSIFLVPQAASAQDRPNTILVLDGSGSMWGQIDGVAKITIAQDVVTELLGTLPEAQQLGLTLYGHRTRGDCSDIETVVAPGPGTRGAIGAAVNAIKPLGRTPMTDAVIAAAQALRYTENAATVVLVSDGVETCNPDPCAAARALEAAGIDFTAHVIGFDIGGDAEALAQMQCIAAETGGQFLTAENAAELSTALVAVAAEPPAPQPVTVTFIGTEGPGGPVITDPLVWSISGPEGQVAQNETAPQLAYELLPGDYAVSALWPQYEEFAELTARVAETGTVTVVFPAPPPPPVEITFVALDGRNGPRITDPLDWQFYQDGAQLGDALTGATITGTLPRGAYRVVVTRPIDGATAEETFGVGAVNATVTLTLPEYLPQATIDAPDEAVAGSTIDVIWTGPDADLDYISAARPEANPGEYESYTYTREGPLLKVTVPAEPGAYELRYILRDGTKVLATRPLAVVPVAATLDAPASATAGATIDVGWTGPDYRNDYIAVSAPGDDEGTWINYTYTRTGDPVGLLLPTEPGEYEIRYTLNQDRLVIARVPITVVAVGATLTVPETGVAGATIPVGWTGPDYRNDYIAVTAPDEADGKWINYTYTRAGNPAGLLLPTEPGDYEIRYALNQDGQVIARAPITVVAVGAALTVPETAVAGSTIQIGWTGPDYQNDFIAVTAPGDDDGTWINYTYTRTGSPLDLVMPPDPGEYEIRYTLRQDSEVIARVPITVTGLTASLETLETVVAGADLNVTWTGPDYRNDFIAIAEVGADEGTWVTYTYTRAGAPLTVAAPLTPGSYEVRYVLNQDRKTAAMRPLEVLAVEATLEAAQTAPAGSDLSVDWTGPNYQGDYISIARTDDAPGSYVNYTNAREGAPLDITMPGNPGDYELRYIARGKPTSIIAARPITVTPVTASIASVPEAKIGQTLRIDWEGPGYRNDRVVITRPGETQELERGFTRDGNPVTIEAPETPGTYEMHYLMDEDRKILATVPLVVSE